MGTIDSIKTRRSVKHHDPEHEMTDAEVKELLGLAMLSPTAFNISEDHSIAMFVAVGKGTKEPWGRPGQLDYDEVVILDRF